LIYHGDLDGNGTVDVIEAYCDSMTGKEVPERDLVAVSAAMPFVREHFSTHKAYGQAGVGELFGTKLESAGTVTVNTLASMVFLNRGGRFEARALPPEAQFSPAFAVGVADCDGDGNEDLFLGQNFFATQTRTSRSDAGRGLWLRGDGKGGFRAVPGQESGVLVYGEQRGAALSDYDADGRVDLVVTQNGAATRLFHNVGARPGLRVRLNGGPGNPDGVGAALRLICGQRFGSVREIHAGSGYWSQDGAVQVMGKVEEPTRLWVRWPGGKTLTTDISGGTQEIALGLDGQVKVIR
jgi:hypothetical protein